MDISNIIVAVGTVITTVIAITSILNSKFNDLRNDIALLKKDHGERIAKLEGKMDHLDGMMQTLLSFLLGHKTGTKDK